MQDSTLQKRLENISDYVNFEAETSSIWPWATPAEELLLCEEELLAVARSIHLDADGCCDTEEMHEALERAFGVNPVLLEETRPEEGMVTPGM